MLVVLAIAGPWYVWVGLRTDWQWPAQFFGVHNFGRFLNAMDNHHGPIFYYVGIVLVLFFPWSILMLGSLSELARQAARTMQRRQGAILIVCWIAVYFCFFSLCGTKLPSYVVPMYPALAIATALFIERWIHYPQTVPRSWPWIAYSLLTLAGLGLLVVVPLVATRLLDGGQTFSAAALARVAPLGMAGLVPLLGGLLCLFYTWRCQARQSIRTLGLTAVMFTIWLFGVSVGQFDAFQTAPQFIAAIDSHTAGEPHVSSFRYFRPSMVFYGHQPVGKLPEAADVAHFFAEHPTDAFVYTVDEQMPELAKQLPADVVVLERRPRLFLSGQTLLLGRALRRQRPAPGRRAEEARTYSGRQARRRRRIVSSRTGTRFSIFPRVQRPMGATPNSTPPSMEQFPGPAKLVGTATATISPAATTSMVPLHLPTGRSIDVTTLAR